MSVLFIMPLALPAYLFQLAALSAFLKSKGCSVKYEELIIHDQIRNFHLKRINKTIEEFKPDVIGFSAYEMSFPWIKEIAEDIKNKYKEILIIVGGYYATLSPEEVLGHQAIDAVCIGEGEYPMLELLDSLNQGRVRKDIQNIWFKDNGNTVRNPLRNLIANLDELPFVDREFFSSENKKQGVLEIMASRGCPFACTNCSNHALQKIYAGKGPYVRYRSTKNVLTEIKECLSKGNFKIIHFEDDMFTINLKWLKEFCIQYSKCIKLPFVCNIRPEAGVLDTLLILKNAGCVQVSIGVETGDEKIRQKVLSRYMSDDKIIKAFSNAKKLGIKRKSFNMVGLPYETPLTLWKTIWLNLRLAPDAVQTSIYYPFKGTVLGNQCYQEGWVNFKRKERLKLYANDSILDLPNLSRNFIKVAKWLNSATALRAGNLRIIKIAINLFLKKIFSLLGFRKNEYRPC